MWKFSGPVWPVGKSGHGALLIKEALPKVSRMIQNPQENAKATVIHRHVSA